MIGVIAILIAILVPALASARRSGRSTVCANNLRSIVQVIQSYGAGNADAIVPSYNTTGVSIGPQNPLDGWGPILDKEKYLTGSREMNGNPYCCPDTADRPGMATLQTGSNPENPRGYMDWPAVLTLSSNLPVTIESQGFDKIIRVGYWINADNPIGVPQTITQGLYFTASVGYGPDPAGNTLSLCYFSRIKKSSELIALADGLYAGKQDLTRQGDVNSRIGYRHGDARNKANIAFSDGHVGELRGTDFPRSLVGGLPLDVVRRENLGAKPTVYADPEGALREP